MNQNSSPSFADLFSTTSLTPGAKIKATVVKITNDFVVVDVGLKSESYIPIEEFRNQSHENLNIKPGDTVDVILETIENGAGETRVSREKAKRQEEWIDLEKKFETSESVFGYIIEKVRGGFTVKVGKIQTFLPASLLDTKPVKDITPLMGKELEFKVVKVDKENNNVVVSRKAVLISESGLERASILNNLHEGDEITGTVKNITDYGAFIDLGGIDGLLHITDMSWKRVRHPTEIVKLGDSINVKVLKIDREKLRVSLGLKQMSEDPWQSIAKNYPVGTRFIGKVTNIADYGCFIKIPETDIEGLVHMSEMDWTNKNINPSKIVSIGQDVEVIVLEVDPDRRRISLGMKQCANNPWKEFAEKYKKGDKITGKVKSITDFGLFLGLEGNIDGLIHLSDLSWTEPGEKMIRNYKKGDDVEAVILAVDPERERISLGVKQLEGDIYADFLAKHPRSNTVAGKVVEVTPKYALVDLGDNIVGRIRAQEVSRETVKDVTQLLAVGDEIEAKVMGFDKKSHQINLSIRELQPELGVDNAPANTQFGDLLKEQMQGQGSQNDESSDNN